MMVIMAWVLRMVHNYKSNYLFGQKRQRRWREAKLKSFEPRRDIALVYEDHTKVGESGDGFTGRWRKALKRRWTPPLTDSLSEVSWATTFLLLVIALLATHLLECCSSSVDALIMVWASYLPNAIALEFLQYGDFYGDLGSIPSYH